MNVEIDVCDGLRLLGRIRQIGERYEAYAADGRPLGAFPTHQKAAGAFHEADLMTRQCDPDGMANGR